MRDFFEILMNEGLYNEKYHNKTENTYHLNGNLIEFISMDMPQKKRGAKRTDLWCNEANELTFEDFMQLNLRTENQVFYDFNPSEEFWGITELLEKRKDEVDYIHSTYKDNPFLNEAQVREIEALQQIDETYWKVYGLGELALFKGLVFTNWDIVSEMPSEYQMKFVGLDFGYTNDPTAVIDIQKQGDNLYFDELIFETGLTNPDIANKLKLFQQITVNTEIFADSAEPKSITEIRQRGFNIRPTIKGRDSIDIGIDGMKRYKLHITKNSINLIREFKNYKWKEDKNGKLTNEPIDMFNHGIDACRYGLIVKVLRPPITC